MARPVALGFLAHSGWAAVVAVAGTPQDPEILDRRRIELFDPAIPADRFPFHAAQELPLAEARKLLARSEAATQKLARSALTDLLTELEEKDLLITACGIVGAPAKSSPPLPTILASHALIHAAEGERFRGVLVEAAEARALRVLRSPSGTSSRSPPLGSARPSPPCRPTSPSSEGPSARPGRLTRRTRRSSHGWPSQLLRADCSIACPVAHRL